MILEPSTCDSYTIDLMRLWRTTEHEKLPTLVASLLLSMRAPALFIAARLSGLYLQRAVSQRRNPANAAANPHVVKHLRTLPVLCYRAPRFAFASIRSVIEENRRLVAHISVSSLPLIPFVMTLVRSLNSTEGPYLYRPVSR